MTESFEHGEQVVDRRGIVWLVGMDGGMAMRASNDSSAGVESIGIVVLEQQFGPLRRLELGRPEPHTGLPRPPWGEALPTTEALARWLRDLSLAQFSVWLERARESTDAAQRCFQRDHDRLIASLEAEIQRLRNTDAHQLVALEAEVGLLRDTATEHTAALERRRCEVRDLRAELRERHELIKGLRRENLELLQRSLQTEREFLARIHVDELLAELRRRAQS